MINIRNLSKSYGSHLVFQNLNMEFEKGNVYGIMGKNGAGKTTLFRCIAGLESYEGLIESQIKPLKNHLGFLMTEPYFFPLMTGEEYIHLMCAARNRKVKDSGLNNVFDLPLKDYISTYSTGMKKKLALTGTLMQGNDCFVLDEPFNGLDIQSNILLAGIIQKLKQLGKTIIVSSHIFSTLSESCDMIYLIHQTDPVRKIKPAHYSLLEDEIKAELLHNKLNNLDIA
jgi:ABC-2 type transport system ATP-binding protein